MKKIVLILAAIAILAVPLFAGGGQSRTAGADGRMELQFGFWWEAEGHSFGPDAIGQFIEDKFNVKIIPINLEWSDYTEQIRLWGATNSLPDTFACYPPAQPFFKDFIDQGLIRSIPYSMISKYPNIKALTDGHDLGNQLRDLYGDYYFITRPESMKNIKPGGQGGMYYRRDWAEKLGFREIPTDMETLYNMLYAFTYNDPNGSGRRDTYGLTFGSGSYGDYCIPFGAFPTLWINGPNGKVVPGYTDEEPMVQALTWLRRAFNDGIIDPEFPRDYNILAQKFAQGTFGAMFRSIHYYWIQEHVVNQFGGANPGAGDPLKAIGAIGQLSATPGGKPYRPIQSETCGSLFSADLSDAKLDKIIEIMDWLLSKEGKDLTNWGFKDVDYRVNADGSYSKIGNQNILDKYPSSTIKYYADWNFDFNAEDNPDYTPEVRAWGLDFYRRTVEGAANARPIINELASFVMTEERSLFLDGTAIEAAMIGIVTGNGDVRTMYRQFIADCNTRGMQAVIDSVNKAIGK